MTLRTLDAAPAPERPRPDAAPAPRDRLRFLPELLLLLVVTLVAAVPVLTNTTPPDPLPVGAPAGSFSADRAHRHVERVASEPRPVGSAAHDRVRDYLLKEIRATGPEPEVLPALGADTSSGAALTAPVQNIRVTLPGTDPTGRVLVTAHYDSVEIGPGATDNGHGVAAMLEMIRALRSGPAARNDITFLFTDGEELGMVGAQAYTASPALGDPDRTVVLNLEARGTSGRVVMFETGAHNAALVPALGDSTPVTNSLAYEVYRLLPNYTDFTAFRKAGLTGMNFANIGTSAAYDTPQDNLARSSRSSLQDLGTTVLAATRELAADDIPAIRASSEATYFTFGGLLVRYPGGWVLPLAALSAAGFAAALWFARRRDAVRTRAVAVTAATMPVPLLAVAAAGWGAWQLVVLFRPDYTGFVFGDPYRPGMTAVGLAVVAVAVVRAWAAVRRRRCTPVELSAAVTGWLLLLAVLTAFLVPGASYLFVWPALAGAAGLALAARLPGTFRGRDAVAALAAVPAAALLVPVAVLLFATTGLALAAVPLVVVALFAATLPVLAGRRPPVRRRIVALRAAPAVVTGLAVIAAGVLGDGVSEGRPAQVSLVYTVDGDTGEARWAGNGTGSHPWADAYLSGGRTALEDTFPPLREPESWRTGPARRVETPTPTLKVLSTRRSGNSRVVRVHLGAEHGAPGQLMLFADNRSGTVESLSASGRKLPGGANRASLNGRWTWGYIYAAPPADGVDLTLEVRGKGPLRLRVLAQTTGFPDGALRGTPPPTVTWAALDSGFTVVSRRFTI
ncbi:M20/M25/M40 family metallo-hydrolase [Streptomyces fructofermentans]|uniref:M20/M25/M40 family metallo-hydrolase n=1 Tax=Streptomyces fructofermentans TaxID=152141 RepID=UPI0037B05D0D